MTTPKKTDPRPEKLIAFREEIDRVDDQLIALLKEREQIVQKVGEFKREQGATGCFIRPGREANMLRRIWNTFENEPFPNLAATSIWRMIIAASTGMESDFRISAYAPSDDPTLFWLAREYFGAFTEITRQPNCNRVVGDIVSGETEVGILPHAKSSDDNWWVALAQQEENPPQIFAHIPFVTHSSENERYSGLAIARVTPEPTGDDISLVAIESAGVSTSKLIDLFTQAELEAPHLQIFAPPHAQSALHLIEVKTFLETKDTQIEKLLAPVEADILRWRVLGAYATPIETRGAC